MPVISFCGESFTVDHAVKGADYIHGYDENSNLIVSLEGITDFSGISYNGEYMSPESCLAERCNDVKYCGGTLKTRDGNIIEPLDLNVLDLKTLGVAINKNDDLNNYKTPGVFYSASSAVSGTLSNSPTTQTGFKLIVMTNYSTSRYMHYLFTNTGGYYFRYYNGTTWTEWVNVAQKNLPLSGGTMTGTLYINNTTDASSTSDNAAALIIGNRTGEHIVFDGNEIVPKSGATKGGTLYLGDSADTVISISGKLRVNSYSFGDTLPEPGLAGRIFFKKV